MSAIAGAVDEAQDARAVKAMGLAAEQEAAAAKRDQFIEERRAKGAAEAAKVAAAAARLEAEAKTKRKALEAERNSFLEDGDSHQLDTDLEAALGCRSRARQGGSCVRVSERGAASSQPGPNEHKAGTRCSTRGACCGCRGVQACEPWNGSKETRGSI